ncbi:MAG: tetratricopeptide repeat protein, partial [Candidatus Eremiobacterota bacterium]
MADFETVARRDPQLIPTLLEGEHGDYYRSALEAAIQHLEWELAVTPGNPAMLILLARTLRAFGHPERAMQAVGQVLQAEPDHVGALRLTAELQGQPGEAVEQLMALLAADPNSVELHLRLAEVYQGAHSLELALRHLERVLDLAPEHPAAVVSTGRIFLKQGRHDQALARLEEAQRRNPDRPELLLGLAECYQAQYRFDEALDLYRRVAEVEPGNVEASSRQADLRLHLGDLDGALACLERARELHPDEPEVHYNLARVHHQRGDLERAATEYRETLRCNPRADHAAFNLGQVSEDRGRIQEAAEAYRMAASIRPMEPQYQSRLASCAMAQGDRQTAFNALLASTRINPNQLEEQLTLARIAVELGRQEESTRAYRHVLNLDPQSEEALMGAVEALDHKHLEPALKAFRALTEREPGRPDGWEGLGRVLARMGKTMQAFSHFQKALMMDPGRLGALRALIALCREYNEHGWLLDCFREVLSRHRGWDRVGTFVTELVNALEQAGVHQTMLPMAGFLHAHFPHQPEALALSARLHIAYSRHLQAAGDTAQAVLTLQRLLELQPHHAEAEALLRGAAPSPAEEAAPEPALALGSEPALEEEVAYELPPAEPEEVALGDGRPPTEPEDVTLGDGLPAVEPEEVALATGLPEVAPDELALVAGLPEGEPEEMALAAGLSEGEPEEMVLAAGLSEGEPEEMALAAGLSESEPEAIGLPAGPEAVLAVALPEAAPAVDLSGHVPEFEVQPVEEQPEWVRLAEELSEEEPDTASLAFGQVAPQEQAEWVRLAEELSQAEPEMTSLSPGFVAPAEMQPVRLEGEAAPTGVAGEEPSAEASEELEAMPQAEGEGGAEPQVAERSDPTEVAGEEPVPEEPEDVPGEAASAETKGGLPQSAPLAPPAQASEVAPWGPLGDFTPPQRDLAARVAELLRSGEVTRAWVAGWQSTASAEEWTQACLEFAASLKGRGWYREAVLTLLTLVPDDPQVGDAMPELLTVWAQAEPGLLAAEGPQGLPPASLPAEWALEVPQREAAEPPLAETEEAPVETPRAEPVPDPAATGESVEAEPVPEPAATGESVEAEPVPEPAATGESV